MRLTTPLIEINQEDPFKNDALNRKQFGEALLNLITRTKEELVICLDAPWGEGKTSFVKMWQVLLKKNQVKSIYFDAFSNDYIDDAFIAIVSVIIDFAEKQKDNSISETLRDLRKKATTIGGQLLSWTTKLGIKAATLGVIGKKELDELSAIKDDIAAETSEVISKFIDERISAHNDEIQNINSFRDTLADLASKVSGDSGKPLVIIIDELDRCKPIYAVEVIERIKHLFLVKNTVFVLVMHKEQLGESIRCLYGQKIDAINYLQKFINIDCRLPKNTEDPVINDYWNYCNRLYALHELETWEDKNALLDTMATLAKHFNLSLRQLEKCFTYISIFYGSISKNHLRLVPVIAFLAILKTIKPEVYARLEIGQVSFVEFIDITNIRKSMVVDTMDEKLSIILLWMKLCLYTEDELKQANEDEKKDFSMRTNSLFRYGVDRKQLIPFYCEFFDFANLAEK